MGYYLLSAGFRILPNAKRIRDGNLASGWGGRQKQYSYEGKSTENKIHARHLTLHYIHVLA